MTNHNLTLNQWQKQNLPILKNLPTPSAKTTDVTAIAHWFWNDERFESDFFSIEFSLRITRHFAGDLPIVFVVNKASRLVEELAGELHLKVIVDKTLTNGLKSLNHEYIVNLHNYFNTEYCLTIQNDGFPIRQGLEFFTGKADYIGAPWPANGDDWITRILLRPDTRVGNGGFSLRSHKICEAASLLYQKKYKIIPFCYLTVDDIFYCRVLSTYEKAFKEQMIFADVDLASNFSVEKDITSFNALTGPPLGVHSLTGFCSLSARKWLPAFENT